MKYTDLDAYCERECLTYKEFGKLVSPLRTVSWNTIYQVITGKQNPGKRTRKVLDAYIKKNQARIRRVLGVTSEEEAA